MPKRCFSKCRGVKEIDCKPPCSFVSKKYCRLSSKLKMKGVDCEIVSKNEPKTKPLSVKPLSVKQLKPKSAKLKPGLVLRLLLVQKGNFASYTKSP